MPFILRHAADDEELRLFYSRPDRISRDTKASKKR
jgi:hypothetical protein